MIANLSRLPAGSLVNAMAAAALVGCAVIGGGDLPAAWRHHSGLFVLAVALIVLGEWGEFTMPSGRRLAPVSIATGLTLATLGPLRDASTVDLRPAVVVLVVGGAQGLALAFDPRRGTRWSAVSARLLGVLVTAYLARRVVVNGRTWWEWQILSSTPRVEVVAWLVSLCGLGVIVERLLAGVARARQDHARIPATLWDEVSEATPLTLALVAPAPMATLLAPIIGISAVPLALTPVVLTYLAVRRYAAVGATVRESVRSLSRLTEAGGYTPRRHAERVAEVAVATARRLGLAQGDIEDVEFAALLHDLGQLGLFEPIPNGATVLAAPGDQLEMARDGAAVIRHSEDLTWVAGIVEAQAVPYRSVVELAERVPLTSRILKVANAFDDFTAGRRGATAITLAIERIHLGLGYEYDPTVVAALEEVVAQRWPATRA